jgi:tripartite-type tricarboxylate transporter receptor subunit TctC
MLATAGGRCLSLRRTSCCDCGDDYYACILLDQLTGERRKAVRLIVPVAAGGPTDIVARMLAEKLSKMWGQQVFIENKGGAGTNIGNEYVAQSFANTPAALLLLQRFAWQRLPVARQATTATVAHICGCTLTILTN